MDEAATIGVTKCFRVCFLKKNKQVFMFFEKTMNTSCACLFLFIYE